MGHAFGMGEAARDETIKVKGGSRAAPIDVSAAVHIWTARTFRC